MIDFIVGLIALLKVRHFKGHLALKKERIRNASCCTVL